jgi:hypothetical protein
MTRTPRGPLLLVPVSLPLLLGLLLGAACGPRPGPAPASATGGTRAAAAGGGERTDRPGGGEASKSGKTSKTNDSIKPGKTGRPAEADGKSAAEAAELDFWKGRKDLIGAPEVKPGGPLKTTGLGRASLPNGLRILLLPGASTSRGGRSGSPTSPPRC